MSKLSRRRKQAYESQELLCDFVEEHPEDSIRVIENTTSSSGTSNHPPDSPTIASVHGHDHVLSRKESKKHSENRKSGVFVSADVKDHRNISTVQVSKKKIATDSRKLQRQTEPSTNSRSSRKQTEPAMNSKHLVISLETGDSNDSSNSSTKDLMNSRKFVESMGKNTSEPKISCTNVPGNVQILSKTLDGETHL